MGTDYSPRLCGIGAGRNNPLCFHRLDFSPAVLLPTAKRGEININENRDFQLSISHPLRGGFLSGSNPAPRWKLGEVFIKNAENNKNTDGGFDDFNPNIAETKGESEQNGVKGQECGMAGISVSTEMRRDCGTLATAFSLAVVYRLSRRSCHGNYREKTGSSGTTVTHTRGCIHTTGQYISVLRPCPLDVQSDEGIQEGSGSLSGASGQGGYPGGGRRRIGSYLLGYRDGCLSIRFVPASPFVSVIYRRVCTRKGTI